MKPKQILAVTKYNFRRWHKNPKNSNHLLPCLRAVLSALRQGGEVRQGVRNHHAACGGVRVDVRGQQLDTAFLAALAAALCGYAVYIKPRTPFYLMRIDRKTWLTGQAAYIVLGNAHLPCVYTGLHLSRLHAAELCGEYVDLRPPQSSATPARGKR